MYTDCSIHCQDKMMLTSTLASKERLRAKSMLIFVLLIVISGAFARKRGICSWRRLRWKQMSGYDDRHIWHVYSVEDCKRRCLQEESFECRSLQYHSIRNLCRLSRFDTSMVPAQDVRFGFFNSVYEVKCTPVWSPWSEWGACSATCGPGFQTRHRECESYDGKGCRSISITGDARPCVAAQVCPVPKLQQTLFV